MNIGKVVHIGLLYILILLNLKYIFLIHMENDLIKIFIMQIFVGTIIVALLISFLAFSYHRFEKMFRLQALLKKRTPKDLNDFIYHFKKSRTRWMVRRPFSTTCFLKTLSDRRAGRVDVGMPVPPVRAADGLGYFCRSGPLHSRRI